MSMDVSWSTFPHARTAGEPDAARDLLSEAVNGRAAHVASGRSGRPPADVAG